MEIKLTKADIQRIKHDYEVLYEQKEYYVSDLGKYIGYPGHAENCALSYIKTDAKIEAIHDVLLVLGMNIWYNRETKRAHITDRDGNEIEGND